jgi:hypothetical protein
VAGCRLRDTTNNTTLCAGMTAAVGAGCAGSIAVQGMFTLTGGANVELQYFASGGTPVLGRNAGSGDTQSWAQVYIRKEA